MALALAPGAARAADQDLLLDVWVNGFSIDKIGEFVLRDGAVLSRREELTSLGFKVPRDVAVGPDGLIALTALPGTTWSLDQPGQALHITAPSDDLATSVLHVGGQSPPGDYAIESGTGATVNYDVNLADTGGQRTAGALLDMRAFSRWGVLSTGLLAQTGGGASGSGGQPFVRLQSAFVYSDTASQVRYTVGDSIGSGLSWTRPIRFGGLQITSDYSMRPDLITFPLPSLAGVAAVPSAVSVLVNGSKILSQGVNAGPFAIPQLPVVTGADTIAMTMTDAIGRQVTVSLPFYAAPTLLAPGLQTWAVQAGAVRRDYGAVSDDYGTLAASFTWRRGMSSWLTLESSGEATVGAEMAGFGATANLFNFAVANVAGSGSIGGGRGGWQVTAGFQREGQVFSAALSATMASARYRDIAAVNGDPAPTLQLDASAGVTLGRFGTVGAAFAAIDSAVATVRAPRGSDPIAQPTPDSTALDGIGGPLSGSHERVLSVSYSVQIRAASIYATTFRDFSRGGGNGVLVGLTFPLGRRSSVNLSGTDGSAGRGGSVQAVQSPVVIGDWGYQAFVGAATSPHEYGEVQYMSPWGLLTGGVDHTGQATTYKFEDQGAVSFTDGAFFPSNTIYDSFAVVDTNGLADVHVLFENRVLGVTNGAGHFLAPDLRSFQVNHLAIDPNDVPMDSSIGATTREVRPQDRSGVVVKFQVKVSHAALLKLVLASGAAVPLGSSGTLRSSGVAAPVGYEGEAFVKDLQPHDNVFSVGLLDGGHCAVVFDYSPVKGEIPTIGPLTCNESAR